MPKIQVSFRSAITKKRHPLPLHFAIVDADGIVIDIREWDANPPGYAEPPWGPALIDEGKSVIQIDDVPQPIAKGWTYTGDSWAAPPPAAPG